MSTVAEDYFANFLNTVNKHLCANLWGKISLLLFFQYKSKEKISTTFFLRKKKLSKCTMQYFYQCVIHVLCIIYNSPDIYIYIYLVFLAFILYNVLSKRPNQNYCLTTANYFIAKKRAKYKNVRNIFS
jgi:hypothetical protein